MLFNIFQSSNAFSLNFQNFFGLFWLVWHWLNLYQGPAAPSKLVLPHFYLQARNQRSVKYSAVSKANSNVPHLVRRRRELTLNSTWT